MWECALWPWWQGCTTSSEGCNHNVCAQHYCGLCLRELAVQGLDCSLFWICFSVCLHLYEYLSAYAVVQLLFPHWILGLKFILEGMGGLKLSFKRRNWYPSDLAWSKTLSDGKPWGKHYEIRAVVGNDLFSLLRVKMHISDSRLTECTSGKCCCSLWMSLLKNPRATEWGKSIHVTEKGW